MNEIKKVLLVSFFFSLTIPVRAQVIIGPKAGFQVSKVVYYDNDYADQHTVSFKPGYNVGLVLNYKVNQTFSMHTELFYSTKGKIEEKEEYNIVNSATYQYLDLPLMLRVSRHKRIKKQSVEYYFNVGPSFGYWLGGKGNLQSEELNEYIDTNTIRYKINFKEKPSYEDLYVPEPNRLQMELNVGGGLVFDMAQRQKMMVDFRYSFGIGQTFMGKKEGGDFGLEGYSENYEGVNHVISLSVAYLFEFDVREMLKKGKSK